MKQIDRAFPIKYFSDTSINKSLLNSETKVLVEPRTPKNIEKVYKQFDEDLKLYLSKLTNSICKKVVEDLYNRNKIYIGASLSQKINEGLMSRPLIESNSKLVGVTLFSTKLDIDMQTGETSNIDECVYATYQSVIRSFAIINKRDIIKDHELHKMLSTYLYLVLLRTIGKNNIYSEKQKNFFHVICTYAYYRHYLDYNTNLIYSTIEKYFKDQNLLNNYDELKPSLSKIERYNDIKDLPKMLIDSDVMINNPNNFNMILMKNLKLSGYYSIIGPLDMLLSMAILSRYPTDLYSRYVYFDKLQSGIEKYCYDKYMSKLKFSSSKILS